MHPGVGGFGFREGGGIGGQPLQRLGELTAERADAGIPCGRGRQDRQESWPGMRDPRGTISKVSFIGGLEWIGLISVVACRSVTRGPRKEHLKLFADERLPYL